MAVRDVSDGVLEWLRAEVGATLVTADYDAINGILTLAGTATVEDYEVVLRTVAYQNTSEAPAPAARIVEFRVSDGHAESPVALATVEMCGRIQLAIEPGWNLLSIPFHTNAEIPLPELLVDGSGNCAYVDPIWSWETEARRYAQEHHSVLPKQAFWLYCPFQEAAQAGAIDGGLAERSMELLYGWNMVGPAAVVSLRNVMGADAVFMPIWYWDALLRVYRAVGPEDELKPGIGYWIYVAAAEGTTLRLPDWGR